MTAWVLLAGALGCPDPAKIEAPAEAAVPEVLSPLPDARLARRLSLDLRGVLPSLAELDSLEAGQVDTSTLRDSYLDDPRFEERFVQLLGQAWRTQVDEFLVRYVEYPELAGDEANEYPFERAVGEEPLRLAARVAAEDLPWATIVTGDWSMANEVTGHLWPVDYPADATGWQKVHYTDGRPSAGILATNGLWWRYFSTVSNYNRGRVAAIARLLLCEDYLSREVSVAGGSSVADAADIEDHLRGNPYCLGCHSSIDPIATALFGFWPANEYSIEEIERYHPEREPLGPILLDVAPSWFGTPFTSLADLGPLIEEDPRFATCAAETMASLLWRREATLEDGAELADVRAAWMAEPRMKAVMRAVTDGAKYRAGGFTAAASAPDLERERVVRQLDAPLLASVLDDLTGFSWSWEGFDQLRSDTWGFRVLGGGVDGLYETRSLDVPSLTWLLVVQRAAESAAAAAVDAELLGGGDRRAFVAVTLDDVPGDEAFTDELVALHRRLYGSRPEPSWTAEVEALWSSSAAEADAAEAWRTTLAALLQDPLFVSY